MTDGEKMVWAAAYAKFYDISGPPSHVVNDTTKWREWEAMRTHQAIEYAAGAVERMREELASIREGFGPTSDVYKMLAAMVKR